MAEPRGTGGEVSAGWRARLELTTILTVCALALSGLSFLVAQRSRAVTREELLTRVWGIGGEGVETRTIDMHIARLRAKLRDPSGRETPEAILTVRAQGYMAGPDLMPLDTKIEDRGSRIEDRKSKV